MNEGLEIDFVDMWRAMSRNKLLILAFVTVPAALVGANRLLSQPQWKAQAVVSPAHLGKADGTSEPLRPLKASLFHVRSQNFKSAVVAKMGVDPLGPAAGLYMGSLSATNEGGGNDLTLALRAYSRDEALKWMEATVQHIIGSDQGQVDAVRKLFAAQARLTESQSDRVRALLLKAEQGSPRTAQAQGNAVDSAALGLAYERSVSRKVNSHLTDELHLLSQERAAYEARLNPELTHPAKSLEPIYAPNSPVSRNAVLFSALAGLLGFIAGGLIAVFLEARRVADQ